MYENTVEKVIETDKSDSDSQTDEGLGLLMRVENGIVYEETGTN